VQYSIQPKNLCAEEKKPDPKKRGKICKLCALIKVRIVKGFIFGSFVLNKWKFLFLKHEFRYA
jgi:hypothetical protein